MNIRSHITLCFALAMALALFIPRPVILAQGDGEGQPSVVATDQETDGTMVSVDSVVADVIGWMVIHADADGRPGSVLGKTAVPAGMTENVIVVLDEPLADTATLWAMLHVDKGEVGTYEFPDGADVPATDGSSIVMTPFVASVPSAEEAMEETPAEEVMEEAPAEDAMEEAPAEEVMEEVPAEKVMEEAPAEEAMLEEKTTAEEMLAPVQLPHTGSGSTRAATNIAVVLFAVLVLAGGLAVGRQRQV